MMRADYMMRGLLGYFLVRLVYVDGGIVAVAGCLVVLFVFRCLVGCL